MNDVIDKVIKTLCDKANGTNLPDAALKYTQAALNLANVRRTLNPVEHVKAMIDAQNSS